MSIALQSRSFGGTARTASPAGPTTSDRRASTGPHRARPRRFLMRQYVTHHFAHSETLDRAERWLLLRGFRPSQIETHREGTPWISVLASAGESVEAQMIFRAAESHDPDGWPSFWEVARMPHPHLPAPTPEDATATAVVTAKPTPVGWHPTEVADAVGNHSGLGDVWDVSTRFA